MRWHSSLSAALVALTVLTHPLAAQFAPPTRNDPASHFVRLQDGTRLHYVESGQEGAASLVLIHGYSDSWFSFSRVLTPLSREAHVYALDLRGHGKTDKPAKGYHMRNLAADVVAFMDAKGIARATVIGHSMGGTVAQQVALAAPQRVSHLVLVGAATAPRNIAGMGELGQAVRALSDPVPESFAREFQVSTVHTPVGDEFMDRAVAESLRLPARVWRELLDGMLATDPAAELRSSGIPILVIRGEKDTYITVAETEALAALVAPKKVKTYLNTGHAVHWEMPATFAKDVLEFVR